MAAQVRSPFERFASKRKLRRGVDWRAELERWEKLQRGMAEVLGRWREAQRLLAGPDPAGRLEGLSRLRALENPLLAAIEQCREEAQAVEPRWRIYAEPAVWAALDEQHEQSARLAHNILNELRYATLDRTEEAAISAASLAALLSDHLAFEQRLLDQIEANRAAEDKLLVSYTESGD
jgi:hypothetical protein